MLWLRLSLDQRLILLDLWGTIHEDDDKFGPDSLVPVFTCSQVCHVMSSVMCDHDMSRQVLTSLVDMSAGADGGSGSNLKVLRVVRALRPLKMITRMPNLAVVVNSTFSAINLSLAARSSASTAALAAGWLEPAEGMAVRAAKSCVCQ